MSIIWLDLETTGLDPNEDRILEVGIIVTGDDLLPIADHSWVISAPMVVLQTMHPDVIRMHKLSGLWDDVLAAPTSDTMYSTENKVLDWFDEIELPNTPHTLAGSGVSRFDIRFLENWMPTLAEQFSYRHIDVSGVKELARIRGTWDAYADQLDELDIRTTHRALDDARHSHAVGTALYRLLGDL